MSLFNLNNVAISISQYLLFSYCEWDFSKPLFLDFDSFFMDKN